MKSETKNWYRVITPGTWSNIDHHNGRLIETPEEAIKEIERFGTCTTPKASEDNKKYWARQGAECKIVKVTQVTEGIDFENPFNQK